MPKLLSFFVYLAMASLLIFLATAPAKRRHLRRRLVLAVAGTWIVSLLVLVASNLQKRPFFEAVESGDLAGVKQLLSQRPDLIKATTFWQSTALHLAARAGQSEIVAFLLKSGADVNAKNDWKLTPLHEAAIGGNGSVADTLLKAGADVNAVGGRHNDTALHIAAGRGHMEVVKVLLKYGANVEALDTIGKTPLQWAEERHHLDVVALLSNPALPKQ